MRLLETVSPSPTEKSGSCLGMVKFLLPLSQDVSLLPTALKAIDTICHLEALAHEIVAVDDASDDGTAREARRYAHFMPLWLIQHGAPRGKDMAFRTAVEAACRDVGEHDLLVPIDPCCCPDPRIVQRAIRAARCGWDAVQTLPARENGSSGQHWRGERVTVYRAGMVTRHLSGFLASPPTPDTDALRQLERYLLIAGVSFYRLPPPLVLKTAPCPDRLLLPSRPAARAH